MNFDFLIGIKEVDKDTKLIRREAARAVIIKDGRALMVHNSRGDFKFPSGGIKGNESHEEALKREVKEETGNTIINIIKKLGQVVEGNIG